MNRTQLLARIERAVERVGTARRLCEDWEISEAYLSDVRNGRREPGKKVLDALGVTAETRYETVDDDE